jgi:hypothetical protein
LRNKVISIAIAIAESDGQYCQMRIWIIAVPCAYLALLLVLAAPLIGVAFKVDYLAPDVLAQITGEVARPNWESLLGLMRSPWTFLWLGTLIAAQVALLLPCGKPPDRPRARRRLIGALIATAFLTGLLFACLAITLVFGMTGDDPFGILDALSNAPISSALGGADWMIWFIIFLSPVVTGWGLWWWILLKATHGRPSSRFPQNFPRATI